jgi:predicted nuclease of restriction endonuclease-like (RecB) superfamily
MKNDAQHYADLLNTIKARIRQAQTKASLSANAEMILMYWDIGRMIHERQQKKGWGAGVIPRLAKDIRNDMPEVKGFSERNIGYMIRFAREYKSLPILQQAVAKLGSPPKKGKPVALTTAEGKVPQPVAKIRYQEILQQLVAQIPWGHNILLMEKAKDLPTRLWYMQKTIEQGWGRNVLHLMIEKHAHERQGKAVTNFPKTLPQPQSDLAQETLKDPYVFDFLSLRDEYNERVLEQGLIDHVQKFLMELGAGFAFVGRQVHLEVGGEDFYVDLLFYHLRLRCFVVIDLKVKEFIPEFAGKMNFYLSAVDELLRHPDDKPSIGIILCKSRNKVVAEYALRDIRKPVGISGYVTRLTESLPKKLKGLLPSPEEIEAELSFESPNS